MSLARITSAQPHLLNGTLITVEIDITKNSLHAFSIVGLPDKAVDEAKDRVSSALKNSGYSAPKSQNQKIVVSLAPADLKKEGSYFDVAIALGYLLANDEISFDTTGIVYIGELSLAGDILPVKGVLALAQEAKRQGCTTLYVAEGNAQEASLIEGITVFAPKNLHELINHLDQKKAHTEINTITPYTKTHTDSVPENTSSDFSLIKGQDAAKRGLLIAAAGGHNIALSGPPGTGKTMLARAFAGIIPALSNDDALEVMSIHSIAGTMTHTLIHEPPFRSPHHTSSYVSIIGGGATPKPGEITLAHKGVLFLDEFPEFDKRVVESLRQPLEDNVVTVARAKGTARFPANFILVAAMNPCPCGFRGSKQKRCICTPSDLMRYERKLSGPIMDRIDLWVNVPQVDFDMLSDNTPSGEGSVVFREKVAQARKKQRARFGTARSDLRTNSDMRAQDIIHQVTLSPDVRTILNQSAERLQLSARAYHRIIKLARTIADLEGSEDINSTHILEALQYRPKIN